MATLNRRSVIAGIAAGLPLATVLADPMLAQAAAHDLETITIQTADGRTVSGALAMPAKTPAPAVLLVHEWWGLNDQIKAVAAEFAAQGYVALACDLYDGKVATNGNRAAAKSYMNSVLTSEATATLVAWNGWLRSHQATLDRLGTVGWCFGGGWSLKASIAAPVDATVVYYGRVNLEAEVLASLRGPVMGHFAEYDKWINRSMVSSFEDEMAKAGKVFENHWYDADHAFANPTSARYDQGDAALAWQRTLEFFAKNLG